MEQLEHDQRYSEYRKIISQYPPQFLSNNLIQCSYTAKSNLSDPATLCLSYFTQQQYHNHLKEEPLGELGYELSQLVWNGRVKEVKKLEQ